MNGISTKVLTHVQVVRLVIMSGSCVAFSVRPGKKQNKPLRQELVRVRPTPLRTQRSGPNLVTPPGSPTSRGFHLPGYQQKHCGTVVDSPSQLPLDVLNLDCMPPPPYTPEVPLRHRVLARGKEGHDVREEEGQMCTHFLQEPQLNQDQQEPQDTHPQLESLGVPQPQPLNMSYQQQQMNDGNEASFDGNIENLPQGCSVMEQDCAPCPILIPEEVEMSSAEKEALIIETAREMSTTLLPAAVVSSTSLPSTSPSPVQSNGRESFLSQIRQFNKEKLKKLALHPEDNSNQLHIISSERNHNPDDQMQRTEDEKDSPQVGNTQENAGSMDLLSALNQAMKHRARVLHDTLSSVDEGDSSDDDDDDEWEL